MSTRVTAGPPFEDQGNGLCLLSLDGGGVRGLSTLLILKRVMEGINPVDPPKPCDYFDMIGGTSTGGLIALMLGRMRLSVDDCIAAYTDLSPKIFTKIHHRVKLSNGKSQGRFNHEALEKGIKNILKKYDFAEDALFKASSEEGACRTFVCATSGQTRKPVVLSSYYNERRGSDMLNVAKIWEVARATSAATTFFEPITIDDETFVDGATGANNPIQYLWSEAGDIWGAQNQHLEDQVRCLVSIGTGMPSLQAFGVGLLDIAKSLKVIATDTEEEAELFEKHHTKLFQTKRAFRFNVLQGLENIGLEEVEKWGDMKAVTRKYIQTEAVRVQLRACALHLQEQEWLKAVRRFILDVASPDIVALNDDDCHPTHNELQWFTHTKAFHKWKTAGTGVLWYRAPPRATNDSRSAIAGSIAYRMSSRSETFAGPQIGVGGKCARTLYFQCDRRLAMDNFGDEERVVTPSTVLWSLICQSLLIGCTDVTALNHRILELPSMDQQAFIDNINRNGSHLPPYLFGLLIRTLQIDETPQVIAIDNLQHLKDSQVGAILEILLLTEKRLSAASMKIPVIVSAPPSAAFHERLHDTLWIDDNSEREECVQSLYFPEWDLRRTQVADAEEGTNDWIWNHPQYRRWHEAKSSVLWIEGKPGSGKSVLAKSIQKEWGRAISRRSNTLLSSKHDENIQSQRTAIVRSKVTQDCLMADWFYTTRQGFIGKAHLSLFKSIMYQLLDQHSSFFEIVAPFYRGFSSHEEQNHIDWAADDMMRMLRKISQSGIAVMCIIDAMDEADPVSDEKSSGYIDSRQSTILSVLSKLILDISGSGLKFIVLSRPEALIEREYLQIQRRLSNTFKIVLEHANQNDIQLIIEKGLSAVREAIHAYDSEVDRVVTSHRRMKKYKGLKTVRQDQSHSEKRSLQNIHSYLQEHASGVILWVTLALGELCILASSGLSTFAQLEERVKALPRKLDAFYEHIVEDLATQSTDEDLLIARQTFLLISGSASLGRPIRLGELWEALAVPSDITLALESQNDPIMGNRIRFNSWVGFRRQLRRKCGPLIDVVKSESTVRQARLDDDSDAEDDIGPDYVVQFMHRTVKDFLQSPTRQGPLHFSEKASTEMVEGVARRYVEIGFPKSQTKYYSPSTANTDGDWHAAVGNLSELLENRILLRFVLTILEKESTQLQGSLNICTWIDSLFCISPDIKDINQVKDVFRKERAFYPKCNTKMAGAKEALENARSIMLGELIRHLCAKGLTVGTDNVLELCHQIKSPFYRNDTYAIGNGALLAAIEQDLVGEVGLLTRRQRHQSNLTSVDGNTTWPVGRKKKDKHLDPFIALAVRAGSVKIIDYLFELTDGFYAREQAVWDYAVTNMNLTGISLSDEAEDIDVTDPSAYIDWVAPLVFADDDFDGLYRIDLLEQPANKRQIDNTSAVLGVQELDVSSARVSPAESLESFWAFDIFHRDLESEKGQERKEFLQLRAGCIYLANEIHSNSRTAKDNSSSQSSQSAEFVLEDVEEAIRTVMDRLEIHDADLEKSTAMTSDERYLRDVVDDGHHAPVFREFFERYAMSPTVHKKLSQQKESIYGVQVSRQLAVTQDTPLSRTLEGLNDVLAKEDTSSPLLDKPPSRPHREDPGPTAQVSEQKENSSPSKGFKASSFGRILNRVLK